jgi:hypothetical protein
VERETALGDLVELGMTGRHAFKGVLGLVLRRQLGFWKEWEPWFVLVAIVVPVCPLLVTQSNGLGRGFFPNVVLWFHGGVSYRTGVSSAALLAEFCFRGSALITWSWTSAFAMGVLSRKAIWINGILLFTSCSVFTVYGYFYPVRIPWWDAWAWILMTISFLIIPAYYGLRASGKFAQSTPPWMIPMAAWTVTIGVLAFWTQGWYDAALDNWSHGAPALTLSQLAQRADVWEAFIAHLLTLAVLTGPIVYLLAMNRFLRGRCA